LPDYLEHFSAGSGAGKGLTWAPHQKGTPHTIVLAAAAMRAADLSRWVSVCTLKFCGQIGMLRVSRILRKFKADNTIIAKLFAKHIKLKEAEQLVKSSRSACLSLISLSS
jgi:protein CMS1